MLKSLKHKTQIAAQLSFSDWLAVAEAWWLLLAFYLVLRWKSYDRIANEKRSIQAVSTEPAGWIELAQRLSRMVTLSSRLQLLTTTCLTRSLTLGRMLARRGIPARLCIGASMSSGLTDKFANRIRAHAWVEVQGQAINEPENLNENFHLFVPSGLPDSLVKQNTLPKNGE